MKIIKIPLQPYSRFHFGEFNTDNNVALNSTSLYAHSDTLFSALINSYSDKNNGAEDFINHFKENNINVSSQFYYIKNITSNSTIYLLPKPVFLDVFTKRDGNHKNRNRIQFVSNGVWQNGFDPSSWLTEDGSINSNEYALIQEGEILLTKTEFDNFSFTENTTIFKISDSPKSPIRAHENASIFYQADLEISKIELVEIGLCFFYKAEKEYETTLKIATNILSKTGLGGEKSNMGRSMSIPVFEDIKNIFPSSKENFETGYSNISLLNPKDENELKNIKYSKTILRGGTGFNGADSDYKVIRMIKEGALIDNNTTKGRLVEIGRDYLDREVWRNGKALLIPILYKKTEI